VSLSPARSRKGDSSHLEYRRIGIDTLALVIPAGHPWAGRQSVSSEEFFSQPLVLREAGSGSRWCLEQALGRAGKSVADTEMIVDATISVLTASGGRRYTGISGAGGSSVKTAHLEGVNPAGGNVCFLDNHIQWRKYVAMTNKITPRGLPQFEF